MVEQDTLQQTISAKRGKVKAYGTHESRLKSPQRHCCFRSMSVLNM